MKRVVITGMGIISPIGNNLDDVLKSLVNNVSGIKTIRDWEGLEGLKVNIAGICEGYDQKRISRKDRRTMGPMAVMASLASLDAIIQSGLEEETISSPDTGVSMGSTTGSGAIIEKLFSDFSKYQGFNTLEGTTFMKIMNHSVSANVSAMLKAKGRVISPCCACATSTQAIGEGFEIIKNGYQKVMICGGADDLHPSTAAVFDVLNVASRKYCSNPSETPKPFDLNRDGLVVSEGAGALVLEEYEHALSRNAKILGEIAGYSTCCDGEHMTSPSIDGMLRSMNGALKSASCGIHEIDYINAHATGTLQGDISEANAIKALCGDLIPVSGTKGFTGHTLAASGVMETIFSVLMMNHDFIVPTKNLENIDPACSGVFHVQERMDKKLNRIMTSNFAFGGINATLILKKPSI
ncbi:MAG: beta-ketoacyl-[acyl-carrier-protein] synthase family protein [Proteobacteria bacterium]|nr:beta-ketoacyl-[acyl-carrier-protein] synthase family protein [Pseudomonadota bacterium]MBU4472068.1 beta-ketoacyl-[acyl-carrier-protein] synthase family protein [Pseudomonadota bacterium]MCG2752934.1 beta-ketoacyl-[acyl-carrier-protein] synthase family protein [Desulfobacteraceae bacterium]